MDMQDEVSIKYIGKREPWSDRLYRTGLVFNCNQVRTIHWDMARKFLRHKDLFESAANTVKAAKSPKADTVDDTQALLDKQATEDKIKIDEQMEVQSFYDQVNVMDKDALKEFAKTHYQQNTNNTKTVENIRLDVTAMIDRFGVM